MLRVGHLDQVDMVREFRQPLDAALNRPMLFGGLFGAAVPVQSGRKRNLPSAWPKPLMKCAVSKSGCTSTQLLAP